MEIKNSKGLTEKEFLESYNPGDYKRPSVTVDMPIFTILNEKTDNYRKLSKKSLNILLIKRNDHPFINQWALPGGFVNFGESTDQAAKRELKEETGIDNVYLEQLYTFSEPGRDPRMWVITCAYMALTDSEKISLAAGDDASDAQWFEVSLKVLKEEKEIQENGYLKRIISELRLSNKQIQLTAKLIKTIEYTLDCTKTDYEIINNEGLAFDHAKIIMMAIERLRGKLEYTDIAFNLMPEYFTLTELQKVYEIILNKELLTANFRRKVAHLTEETNKYTKCGGHRPSKLFKRRNDL